MGFVLPIPTETVDAKAQAEFLSAQFKGIIRTNVREERMAELSRLWDGGAPQTAVSAGGDSGTVVATVSGTAVEGLATSDPGAPQTAAEGLATYSGSASVDIPPLTVADVPAPTRDSAEEGEKTGLLSKPWIAPAGGAVAGAVIGFLFGGPIGALIGAAIGGLAGWGIGKFF